MVDAAALYGPGGRGGEDDLLLSEELAPLSSSSITPGEEEEEEDREEREFPPLSSSSHPSSSASVGGVSWNTRTLDWSGDGDDYLDAARARLLEAGAAAAGSGSRLRVAADLDPSSAVGLWVCVHRPGGVKSPAKMYLSVVPLNQKVDEEGEGEEEESGGERAAADGGEEERDGGDDKGDGGGEESTLSSSSSITSSSAPLPSPSSLPEPFAIVASGIPFREPPDDGPHLETGWSSYRVTLLGGVSAEEDHVLWPNQMLHGARSVHNVRGAADVAGFLVAADRGSVVSHALNLRGLAEFKGREAEWCWELLAQRWGRDELIKLGCGIELFEGLPRRRRRRGKKGGSRRKHEEQQEPERHAQAEGEW